jgi:hypothetical protein
MRLRSSSSSFATDGGIPCELSVGAGAEELVGTCASPVMTNDERRIVAIAECAMVLGEEISLVTTAWKKR